MKILLLDNYDSFTYNLFHLADQYEEVKVEVFRNDEISLDEVSAFDRIIISPGPGIPSEAGITMKLLEKYHSLKPILGICLGMQAMAEVCGGTIINMQNVLHGVAMSTKITDEKEKLFNGIPSPFLTGHYHSWYVDKSTLPKTLKVTSVDNKGRAMSMTHENNLFRGVQFHPESVLTEYGNTLMANWLFRC
jgi:anthranilate synthase component 2